MIARQEVAGVRLREAESGVGWDERIPPPTPVGTCENPARARSPRNDRPIRRAATADSEGSRARTATVSVREPLLERRPGDRSDNAGIPTIGRAWFARRGAVRDRARHRASSPIAASESPSPGAEESSLARAAGRRRSSADAENGGDRRQSDHPEQRAYCREGGDGRLAAPGRAASRDGDRCSWTGRSRRSPGPRTRSSPTRRASSSTSPPATPSSTAIGGRPGEDAGEMVGVRASSSASTVSSSTAGRGMGAGDRGVHRSTGQPGRRLSVSCFRTAETTSGRRLRGVADSAVAAD